jgi:hypothetical protein
VKDLLIWASVVAALVAVLLTTTFALAALASLFDGEPILATINVRTGLTGALLVALIVASFHLRKTTVQLRISSRDPFLRRMRKIFEDLGHVVVRKSNIVWRTQPAFRALMLGEGITLVLEGNIATITGPSLSLDQIRRRYRMASHLEKLQESMTDSRLRGPECFLKRFELSARLEPCQLADFQKHVLETLGQDASVVLDVQMMASSDAGVRESVWINDVQPWLDSQGITYEFHRDHAQRISPHGGTMLSDSTPNAAPGRGDKFGLDDKTDSSVLDTRLWSSI